MTKRTVTLKLSISNKNTPEAEQFFADLQEIIESYSTRGLEVAVISDGAEIAVLESFDRETHIPEHEVDPEMLAHVKSFIRPVGVCNGIFVYRKDSIAVLRLRMIPDDKYQSIPG